MKKCCLVALILLFALQAAAFATLKNDPVYRDARLNGAQTRIELHIQDNDETPVPDAKIKAYLGMNFRPRGTWIDGTTDTNGVETVRKFEEVRAEIRNLAAAYSVEITDSQVNQILKLCRKLEGLDEAELQEELSGLATTADRVTKVQKTVSKVFERVTGFFDSVGGFFSKLISGQK